MKDDCVSSAEAALHWADMKTVIHLGLLLSFGLSPSPVQAGNFGCGGKPSVFERLLTNAEEVRLKCIDDYFAAQKEKNARLAAELSAAIKMQKQVLRQSAYEADKALLTVSCAFPASIPSAKQKTEQCRKELALYQGLIAQLDHLMGWDRALTKRTQGSAEEIRESLELPCPDEQTLNKIQPIRYFKKNLYKVYERCRILAAGG